MRAAAVQLNSTDDKQRNLAAADRLTRAAAADGADLIVLPEKFNVLGPHEAYEAGAEALDGPTVAWARDTARELGVDLVAGSFVERREGHDKLGNTSVHVGPRRRAARRLPQDPHVRRDRGGQGVPRVHLAGGRRRDRDQRGGGGTAGAHRLLRPALSRAVPDPRREGRSRDHDPRGLHQGHRRGALGHPGARPRDREPGVRGRGRPDRHPSARQRELRRQPDRGPWGEVACARSRPDRSASSRPTSTSSARTRCASRCPASPTACRRPTAGPRRRESDGHRTRRRARQAPHDPRRRRHGLRAPGLPPLPRLGRGGRGGGGVRPRLPLLRLQGGDPQRALPRALADHARRDRRDRLARDSCRARDKLYQVAGLHHRLLPQRARPHEGDHRRGHPRRRTPSAACTSTRSARPTRASPR